MLECNIIAANMSHPQPLRFLLASMIAPIIAITLDKLPTSIIITVFIGSSPTLHNAAHIVIDDRVFATTA